MFTFRYRPAYSILNYFSVLLFAFTCVPYPGTAQVQEQYSSSKIFQEIQKLKVTGSVLYIAAHPDDENTRLLSYLANERLVRTGYLSLTRGDGGQNLIGNEQGVALGLIRTQELLAARRIDGAEQFFSTAYDFGYSKSSEEAFKFWDKEKILSDVVWIIRKFRPDVIIARFPGDERAGHGHHAASGILAREAFHAAADPKRFPDQLKRGVQVWQARRVLWNTFSFGNTNTITDDQFNINVGGYNTLLGQSNGELAAHSRSQHKSQGFGVASSRGNAKEYFETIGGDAPRNDLFDGVKLSWAEYQLAAIDKKIDQVLKNFNHLKPGNSVTELMQLQRLLLDEFTKVEDDQKIRPLSELITRKSADIADIIRHCSGLYFEAVTSEQFAVSGDSLTIRMTAVNRSNVSIKNVRVKFQDSVYKVAESLAFNEPANLQIRVEVKKAPLDDQPYWLIEPMNPGSFAVNNPANVGLPINPNGDVSLMVTIEGFNFTYPYGIQQKLTDPVKGEVYRPVITVPPILVSMSPGVVLNNLVPAKPAFVQVNYHPLTDIKGQNSTVGIATGGSVTARKLDSSSFRKNNAGHILLPLDSLAINKKSTEISGMIMIKEGGGQQSTYSNDMRLISYDHIPPSHYLFQSKVRVVNEEVRTIGRKVGYIAGAGDNVPDALKAMGYEVVMLGEEDLVSTSLQDLDAIITGVRAYNVHAFLTEKYDVLMDYVQNGGNLIVQYNTNSMIGPIRSRMAPYPFTISRTRVSDEQSPVKFALPNHPVLNYPNKITAADFENWVQERGIYFADQMHEKYQAPLLMNDPNEKESSGSLIISDHGKGKFIYTGIVFFRELPAGVPGAYRLLANIIALNQGRP